jgi:polyferredoxin
MVSKEEFKKADLDGDGQISEQEMQIYLEAKRREMEDEDAKRDQQRKMVWFALFGMLLYPLFVFGTEALGFSNASGVIGDMAPTYFMAVSVVVGAFFGADAYVKGKDKSDNKKNKDD